MSLLTEKKQNEIQMRICEAMETNYEMTYLYIDHEDKICYFIGTTHYWDEGKNEIRIINTFKDVIRLKLSDLINVYRS